MTLSFSLPAADIEGSGIAMLKHADVWRAIDRLAEKYGMSPSGLARRAGLDPTTFNKSKRITKDNKQRWPSTESIAKILEATGASLAEFVSLIGEEDITALARRIPIVSHARARTGACFDEAGRPIGNDWDEILFPEIDDSNAYALEISGNSLEPVYSDGAILIVSPSSGIRRGDRIVAKIHGGGLLLGQLIRQTARRIEVTTLNPIRGEHVIDMGEVVWMARIIWASQ